MAAYLGIPPRKHGGWAHAGRPALQGHRKFDGGAGDAVDRAANSDGGQHWWLRRVSRPRWRGESNCGRSSGWCHTRGTPGRIRTSRLRRLRRASRSSASTIRSWWTPAPGIIAGHGRLLAARKLGLEHVPVVVLDHLSETQKRAYIIADNRISENAGWDEALLAAELGELKAADCDLGSVGLLRRGARRRCSPSRV